MPTKPSGLRVYLAGPEVFLLNAEEVARAKIAACAAHGFVGISPSDNDIDISGYAKHEAALRIAAANEEMIRRCDLVIANLTPFRGPSADVGTAYEIGFARSLARPVFAYTNLVGTLLERMRETPGGVNERASGRWEDRERMAIEDFDGFDNLMLIGALEGGAPVQVRDVSHDQRFSDLRGFEACLILAARRFGFDKKL
jgi:nucleoside 2-deoxyribosyltransferase